MNINKAKTEAKKRMSLNSAKMLLVLADGPIKSSEFRQKCKEELGLNQWKQINDYLEPLLEKGWVIKGNKKEDNGQYLLAFHSDPRVMHRFILALAWDQNLAGDIASELEKMNAHRMETAPDYRVPQDASTLYDSGLIDKMSKETIRAFIAYSSLFFSYTYEGNQHFYAYIEETRKHDEEKRSLWAKVFGAYPSHSYHEFVDDEMVSTILPKLNGKTEKRIGITSPMDNSVEEAAYRKIFAFLVILLSERWNMGDKSLFPFTKDFYRKSFPELVIKWQQNRDEPEKKVLKTYLFQESQ